MPHVVISDPETKEILGAVCIDRDTQTCFVLQADIEHLDTLVSIAKAQKVNKVLLVVAPEEAEQLKSYGWKTNSNLVVMVKGE